MQQNSNQRRRQPAGVWASLATGRTIKRKGFASLEQEITASLGIFARAGIAHMSLRMSTGRWRLDYR